MGEGKKDAIVLCLEQVRRFDHDRFLTLAFVPADRQAGLAALYAFNAEIARIAELVSEPMLGQIRLQWWREMLEALGKGETGGHFVAEAFVKMGNRAPVPQGAMQRLINARERDLDDAPFPDLRALETYAEETSSTLIAAALEILGGEAQIHALAVQCGGIAYALTGLLRAIGAHAAQGRVLLPADLLNRHGVDPHDMLAGRMTDALRAAAHELIGRAQEQLALARAVPVPRHLLAAILPVALCDKYLAVMSAPGFNFFGHESEVPAFRRQLRLFGRRLAGKF